MFNLIKYKNKLTEIVLYSFGKQWTGEITEKGKTKILKGEKMSDILNKFGNNAYEKIIKVLDHGVKQISLKAKIYKLEE